ncbi:MAG TPA: extracellular solute-binding protein [Candidatus Hydrogenedentes bacterium]|nr:extracellular solute-binding protein [Candidatus Hydrogenedentota bacterium]HIJ74447.1 extracellular solute-binding protein [Candidatus Hydrogenedentota bacterium]
MSIVRGGICIIFLLPFCALHVAAAEREETTELHVWGLNMGYPRAGWLAVVAEFERRRPEIDVILGPADRGSDLQKLLCGVVGNAPPDVFKREANLFGDIASRGILMPLDDFIEADRSREDGLHENDYKPGVWESCRGSDGHMYAVPEATNALFLAYNKDVFREAGLDPERPPRDWQEWQDYARRLTLRDENGRVRRIGTMIHAPYMEDDLVFYIAQLGGNVLSADGRTCLLDGPEALDALTFIVETIQVTGGRRAFDDFAKWQEGLGTWPLGQGHVAMSVTGHSVLGEILRRGSEADIGMAPVPAPTGRKPITTSARHGLYLIPTRARHPDEAWDFIRFAAGPEGQIVFLEALAEDRAQMAERAAKQLEQQARLAEARGDPSRAGKLRDKAQARRQWQGETYPGFRANAKTQRLLQQKFIPRHPVVSANYKRCAELIQEMAFVPIPRSPVYAVIRDECQRAVDRALYGEMSPKEALLDADRRVQEQLDAYFGRERFPLFPWRYAWSTAVAIAGAACLFFWWRSREERARTSLQRYENRMGLLFISPWVIGFVVFIAGPMLFSLAISFCNYDVIHPARFAGLENYAFMLFNDPLFWKSLWNTAFMVLALPLGMSVSLLIAVLLNTKVRGMRVYRTLFYLPAVTPAIAAAVLWYGLLNPDGLLNVGLRRIGIDNPPSWLGDARWSKPAIVIMGIWGAGGGMILWLAGLQGIPKQLYEAASIDGAGRLRQFRSITLPMLTPYVFFALVTGVIGVFQIFAQALVLTRGGPADSTLFYVYYLFNNAFRYFKMGYASAMAWILFLIVLIATLIQWRLSRQWVHYE